MTQLPPELRAELDKMTISYGGHTSKSEGTCALELVDFLDRRRKGILVGARDKLTDRPACVSKAIGEFCRIWNDSLGDGEEGDEKRKRLLGPLLPLLLDTAGSKELETARAWVVVDWLARTYAPAWLQLAGLKDEAEELRAMPELTKATANTALQIQNCIRKKRATASNAASHARDAARDAASTAASTAARDAARDAALDAASTAARAAALDAALDAASTAARAAARDAALDAAWDAARDAALDAAWDAARAAALDAAWAAARDAAWDAARDAARDAAWDAARDAAWDAARAAAWAAARDAAWDAARAAAWDAARDAALDAASVCLSPVVEQLQASAQDLVRRMCALKDEVQ